MPTKNSTNFEFLGTGKVAGVILTTRYVLVMQFVDVRELFGGGGF